MAAQSLSARIYWELMRSTFGDRHRDHQADLNNFADVVCTQLVGLAGDAIDFAPRGMTAPIENEPDARQIYFWVPTHLAEETWTEAISYAGKTFAIMAPRDDWEFSDGPEQYENWHQACRVAGAR